MRTEPRSNCQLLAVVLLLPALAGPAAALAQHSDSQAKVSEEETLLARQGPEAAPSPPAVGVGWSGQLVVIEPRVSGVATSVYVSCADGTYTHREFAGAGTALVELARADGAAVGDGRCKYEVYVHPPVDEEAMRAAEQKGDFATVERLSRIEQQQTVITSGVFRVVGGSAVGVGTTDSGEATGRADR